MKSILRNERFENTDVLRVVPRDRAVYFQCGPKVFVLAADMLLSKVVSVSHEPDMKKGVSHQRVREASCDVERCLRSGLTDPFGMPLHANPLEVERCINASPLDKRYWRRWRWNIAWDHLRSAGSTWVSSTEIVFDGALPRLRGFGIDGGFLEIEDVERMLAQYDDAYREKALADFVEPKIVELSSGDSSKQED